MALEIKTIMRSIFKNAEPNKIYTFEEMQTMIIPAVFNIVNYTKEEKAAIMQIVMNKDQMLDLFNTISSEYTAKHNSSEEQPKPLTNDETKAATISTTQSVMQRYKLLVDAHNKVAEQLRDDIDRELRELLAQDQEYQALKTEIDKVESMLKEMDNIKHRVESHAKAVEALQTYNKDLKQAKCLHTEQHYPEHFAVLLKLCDPDMTLTPNTLPAVCFDADYRACMEVLKKYITNVQYGSCGRITSFKLKEFGDDLIPLYKKFVANIKYGRQILGLYLKFDLDKSYYYIFAIKTILAYLGYTVANEKHYDKSEFVLDITKTQPQKFYKVEIYSTTWSSDLAYAHDKRNFGDIKFIDE